jgi:hypothetical protein
LHGKRSSFHLAPGTAFWYQHDARALSDGSGVSLFDDASQQPPNVSPEKQSWGKVISLDERTMRATLRHQFRHATSRVDAASEGNVQLLANGAHMVGFGSTSYLAEYAPSGDSLTPQQILDGRLPSGITSYRAFMGDWVGEPPLDELAFVVRRSSGPGVFDAFVSWNGATKVDTWRISAGTARSPLTAVKRVPKAGFETAVQIVSDGASHFQASAFDREGRLLGSSRVVSTS